MAQFSDSPFNLALIDAASETGWLWRGRDRAFLRHWAWLGYTDAQLSLVGGQPLGVGGSPLTAREALEPLLAVAAHHSQGGEQALAVWRDGDTLAFLARDSLVRGCTLAVTDQTVVVHPYRAAIPLTTQAGSFPAALETVLTAYARQDRGRLASVPVPRTA